MEKQIISGESFGKSVMTPAHFVDIVLRARSLTVLAEKLSPWRERGDSGFVREYAAEAGMRGTFVDQGGLFSYIAPEARVPANHPLRKIRKLVRDVLGELTLA